MNRDIIGIVFHDAEDACNAIKNMPMSSDMLVNPDVPGGIQHLYNAPQFVIDPTITEKGKAMAVRDRFVWEAVMDKHRKQHEEQLNKEEPNA